MKKSCTIAVGTFTLLVDTSVAAHEGIWIPAIPNPSQVVVNNPTSNPNVTETTANGAEGPILTEDTPPPPRICLGSWGQQQTSLSF